MAIPRDWDETSPADDDFVSQYPANARNRRDAVREIFEQDHVAEEDEHQGKHKALRMRGDTLPSSGSEEGVLGVDLRASTGRYELRYRDDDGQLVWLTEDGEPATAADPSTAAEAAQMGRTTSQSIANSSETTVNFNASDFDSDGDVVDLANNRFTVPSGFRFVQLSFFGDWADDSGGQRVVLIRRNGNSIAGDQKSEESGNAIFTITSPIQEAEAGDHYTAHVTQESGGSLNLQAGVTFTITLIP